MPRQRDNNGKFVPSQTEYKAMMTNNDSLINVDATRVWLVKGVALLILFAVISPWVFLIVKNNSIGNVSQKITDFYDENFSCKSMENEIKILRDGLNNKTCNTF